MRDPNRIDPILARLRAAWIADPDLRLGQLIIGSLPAAWPSSRLGRFARLFNAECSEFGAVNAPIVWPDAASVPSAPPAEEDHVCALLEEAAVELRDIASNESRASRMYAGGVANIGSCEDLAARLDEAKREQLRMYNVGYTRATDAARAEIDHLRSKLADAKRLGLKACEAASAIAGDRLACDATGITAIAAALEAL